MSGPPDEVHSFAEDDQSGLLIGSRMGLHRLVNGRVEPYSPPDFSGRFNLFRMLRDHDGSLWIGTQNRGLLHVHAGKTDAFSEGDGLSGDVVERLFEDREGNVWVATLNGLDRFRDYSVPNVSLKQGLSSANTLSALADKNGSVWIATNKGLNRWKDGQISLVGGGKAGQKPDAKLGAGPTNSLFQDSSGRIWVSTGRESGYLENGRFVPVRDVLSGWVHSMAEAPSGHLWIANQQAGLFHLFQGKVVQQIQWAGLGHKDYALSMAADPSQKGLWLGFGAGGVAYFEDGAIRTSYSEASGLGTGQINGLRFGTRGALWAATEGGLSRIKDGHVATLSKKNGLPCDRVHWSMQDDDHSAWLYMVCGLVRITRPEMDAWVADPSKLVTTTVFDISDGVRSHSFPPPVQSVTKSADGKIWFVAFDGVSVVDPRHLAFNKLPPPVQVEQIVADHTTYAVAADAGGNGNVRLPPRARDLQIDYTALSLVAPEKVFFRYKLEGWDRDWQEAGTRRQAFYNNLPPRKYRFRLMACNNSGVWNEAGAAMDFVIAPAYWQTWWFRSLCVAAFVGLLVTGYRLRLHQAERELHALLEGRVAERTRIARELHDTLLQSFQGTLLKLHAVTYMVGDRPEAHKALEGTIEQARQAITEGRDAVQGMRSSMVVSNDLARAITVLGGELTSYQGENHCPEFHVQVEGTSRDLAPILRDDVYRITSEAVRNAFRHAAATRIEVEIRYDARELRLRIRDNGKGIDPKVLEDGGRVGHYGLPSMKERAKLMGGNLTVWSELGSGAETELTLPAAVAYAKSPTARWPKFWRKGA
jgi:signal transduction histidine kinase